MLSQVVSSVGITVLDMSQNVILDSDLGSIVQCVIDSLCVHSLLLDFTTCPDVQLLVGTVMRTCSVLT